MSPSSLKRPVGQHSRDKRNRSYRAIRRRDAPAEIGEGGQFAEQRASHPATARWPQANAARGRGDPPIRRHVGISNVGALHSAFRTSPGVPSLRWPRECAPPALDGSTRRIWHRAPAPIGRRLDRSGQRFRLESARGARKMPLRQSHRSALAVDRSAKSVRVPPVPRSPLCSPCTQGSYHRPPWQNFHTATAIGAGRIGCERRASRQGLCRPPRAVQPSSSGRAGWSAINTCCRKADRG
jgi:hypothetical protein